MTVRERVLTSRLIEKIDNNAEYARKIGLGYVMIKSEDNRSSDLVIASQIGRGNSCGKDNV